MKKILAIIGSPNDEKSNTATMVRDFIENVREYNQDIECEVISLGKHHIDACHGCQACFKTGCCVFRNDDLPAIRAKIQGCDLLIIGTPVYEQMVSSQTKALFDRTFQWIHLHGLMGKPTLTAVTSGGDGIFPAQTYLSIMLQFMGCIIIGHLKGIGQQPGFFPDRMKYKKKYKPLARKVASILKGDKRLKPHLINYLGFYNMRHHTKRCYNYGLRNNNLEYTTFEYNYWKSKGWYKMSYYKAFQTIAANNKTRSKIDI